MKFRTEQQKEADDFPRQNPGIGTRFLISLVGLFALWFFGGCGVKRTVSVPVSSKILQAKTATLDELSSLLNSYDRKLEALSASNLKINFTSGKAESGKLQEYRSAPGYILVKRPNLLRLNIQNPVTKTSIAELSSLGDEFSIWYPRENKFFIGRNSTKEFDLEGGQSSPVFTARPIHILEAIFPYRVAMEDPKLRIAMEEDRDATAKYYALSLFETVGEKRLQPVRRIWLERSMLAVVRQQTYAQDGSIASIITYSNLTSFAGFLLPLSIRIERPADGYSLDMQFKSWRVNADIPATAFVMSPPPASHKIYLKEKLRSENP